MCLHLELLQVVPSFILAIFIYPHTYHSHVSKAMWAIAVLPPLTMMQKTKMMEASTAHYVFALGVARFFGCAHWVIQSLKVTTSILGRECLEVLGSNPGEKINPLLATDVHLRRLRAIQKGSRSGICRLAMPSRKPRHTKKKHLCQIIGCAT